MTPAQAWSRRAVLAGGLAAVATACTGGGSDSSSTTAPTTTTTAPGTGVAAPPAPRFTAADFEGLGTCTLTPEQTAGPFPLDEQFVRTDVTEGVAGTPLRLGFRVVEVVGDECGPVYPASVEVWHADATGDYSAFIDNGGGKDDAEGTTFLRGTQQTDDVGIAQFATIYPGWYTGRAVHIHVRVRVSDTLALTTQVYFDPEITDRVYQGDPYAEFGSPDTGWDDDGIAGDPIADGTALTLAVADDEVTGLINLGVPV